MTIGNLLECLLSLGKIIRGREQEVPEAIAVALLALCCHLKEDILENQHYTQSDSDSECLEEQEN